MLNLPSQASEWPAIRITKEKFWKVLSKAAMAFTAKSISRWNIPAVKYVNF